MNLLKKVAITSVALAFVASTAQARDQVRVVGSSTVYPFSSYVAEEFGATTKFPTPVIESTGSGGGLKLFCSGNGMNTPDITNASRAMKLKEWKQCQKNGVTEITGAMIGYDGIVFAQSSANKPVNFTSKQIFLAVAKEVPINGKLVANPYTKWSDIDSSLPNQKILVYGPPTSSGTRDAFEELVMEEVSEDMAEYGNDGYTLIRQDGLYVPSGENDNLIVQKLSRNKSAFGIFGYGFLAANSDRVMASKVDGYAPNAKTVADGSYPISRSLYFYIKTSHIDKVPALKPFIDKFMSNPMIGDEGLLQTIGLIPLAKELRGKMQSSVTSLTPLTVEMVKDKRVK